MADTDSTVRKRCTKCEAQLPATLEFFGKHPAGRYGLQPRCRQCRKVDEAQTRSDPARKAYAQAWRSANKERVREYNKAYRAAGYTSTAHVAAWRAANIEEARRKEAASKRRRRASDPAVLLKCRVSARLNAMLRGKAGRSTVDLLGYTAAELKAHIERQFTRGMTWDKVFGGEIHIDHIVPVSAFSIRDAGDPDFAACWALSNLRPMWAKDNRRKGAKVLSLL
jgi:hypothetical protein